MWWEVSPLLHVLIDHEETASALRGAAVTSNKPISLFLFLFFISMSLLRQENRENQCDNN
jgi:hypothetical protein